MADPRGWDDVLRRARRLRRRRRRRTAVVGAAAVLLASVGSLTAVGQVGSFLSHSKEPPLLLRADLRTPRGTYVGSLEIELHRAALVLGRRVLLRQWAPRSAPGETIFPARWFLEYDGIERNLARASLYVGSSGRRLAALCSSCTARASGRIQLAFAQASALVNDEATFVLVTDEGARAAAGRVDLDRSHLRRGVLCTREAETSCTRIYTGRS